jgi:hypothetical protein
MLKNTLQRIAKEGKNVSRWKEVKEEEIGSGESRID